MDLPEKFRDFRWFAERFFSIRDRHGNIVPFKLNPLQVALNDAFIGRDDVLKARQGGCSTYVEMRMLHKALTNRNFRGIILAHEHRGALELIEMVDTAIKHMPDGLRPTLEIDTRQEIKFRENSSRILAATAKNPDIGRGGSINMLHCSEVAAWDNPVETLSAIRPSLPPEAEIVRESTAKGAGSYWHQQWIAGKNGRSGYRTHFFNWSIEPSYTIGEPKPDLDPDEFEDGRRQPFVLSDRERELGLVEGQARWRRRMVTELKAKFPQEYAEDDVTCFLTSGRSVFNNKHLARCYEILAGMDARGELVKRRVEELGLSIYHELDPARRKIAEFVIGADPAEGIPDSTDDSAVGDFCHAPVIEKISGVQVASIHGSWEPYEFAQVLDEVGRKYYSSYDTGAALLGVERNNHGAAVLSELHNHRHYPNLYWAQHFDARKQRFETKLGWHTNQQSRPIMIDQLVKAIHKAYYQVRDPEMLAECLTFVKNQQGRPEAQAGCHDDRVMSAAIAWQMRQRSSGVPLDGINLP